MGWEISTELFAKSGLLSPIVRQIHDSVVGLPECGLQSSLERRVLHVSDLDRQRKGSKEQGKEVTVSDSSSMQQIQLRVMDDKF